MIVRQIAIADVKVERERFRGATGDMKGLQKSLEIYGQLEPIILDDKNELIAGFRRMTAAAALGWTHISAVLQGEVPELLAREMELEENIQREQMTWQERERAIAELDRIKSEKDPNWTQSKTAAAIGPSVDQRDVSQAKQITKMMELFPEIAKAKSKNQALSWIAAKADKIIRRQAIGRNKVDYADIESRIILGDSVDVIKTVPDESFHAIITDPPFGIDYDRRTEGQIGTMNAYKDDAENYERLLTMAPDLYRVIKPNGWLIWFLGISWYERCKEVFREAGFIVDEIPVIWDRSEGRSYTIRPDRYFGRSYDIALHCIKGEPQMVERSKPNIIRVKPVEGDERDLLVERPVGLYAELIRRLTISGETVADFFVGSGSCPAAAAMLGREFFGVEQNPERRAIALEKIRSHAAT